MLPTTSIHILFTLTLVHGFAIPDSNGNLHTAALVRGATRSPLLEGRVPPKPAPKPAPKPSTPAPPGSKPAQPAPAPGKAPLFPKLSVPYVEDAIDLCDVYINCDEENDDLLAEGSIGARTYHDESYPSLSKRGNIVPKLPGGKLTLIPLAYPESGALYTGPRSTTPKEVFDFKDKKLGTTSVKKYTDYNGKSTADYATEHIVELQSHGMFMLFATGKDKTLDAFFRNKYVKPVTGTTTIANRPGKPGYTLGTAPPRDSLMRLVFEAMGSTPNPADFVLCEQQINSLKARVWATKQLMSPGDFDAIVDDAMLGAIPSSTFLSALRLVFGVYGYMNDPSVVTHLKSINSNIRKELGNAGVLYNEPKINLVPIWDDFIKGQFKKAEDHGKQWLRARFPATKIKIEAAKTKYVQMAAKLKSAEEGKDAVKHADVQKKAQTQLETKVKTQETAVTAARTAVNDLKKLRTTGTPAQKKGLQGKIERAKKALKEKEAAVAKSQRAIYELYSHSVNLIIKNLEKDSSRVSNFEQAIASLKLTAP